MRGVSKFLVGLFVVALIALPGVAHMQGLSPLTSFGGRVVTVLPCSGGMIHITIIPSGLFPISYIWTPATITKLYGPPVLPGQQVLGTADIPFVCFLGVGVLSVPVPLFGLRMFSVGTSLPGAPVLSI